jgi:hypothetical protein
MKLKLSGNIGKLSFGVRDHKSDWNEYLFPKETQGKNHTYFKFGIWWLIFYAYYPKRCPLCNEFMGPTGGIRVYDNDDKCTGVFCQNCITPLHD